MYCYYSGLPSPHCYAEEEEIQDFKGTDIDRIIEMAWEDRTPFEAIELQFGLSESQVRALMKKELRIKSYILWRKRIESNKLKHLHYRTATLYRFKSSRQTIISNNKISKRK